jgi:ribosomal protein L31
MYIPDSITHNFYTGQHNTQIIFQDNITHDIYIGQQNFCAGQHNKETSMEDSITHGFYTGQHNTKLCSHTQDRIIQNVTYRGQLQRKLSIEYVLWRPAKPVI